MSLKIKVYEEKTEEEGILRLRLREECGGVTLIIVDENGERVSQGDILWITPHGLLHLCSDVSEDCGLQLGADDQIKLE